MLALINERGIATIEFFNENSCNISFLDKRNMSAREYSKEYKGVEIILLNATKQNFVTYLNELKKNNDAYNGV